MNENDTFEALRTQVRVTPPDLDEIEDAARRWQRRRYYGLVVAGAAIFVGAASVVGLSIAPVPSRIVLAPAPTSPSSATAPAMAPEPDTIPTTDSGTPSPSASNDSTGSLAGATEGSPPLPGPGQPVMPTAVPSSADTPSDLPEARQDSIDYLEAKQHVENVITVSVPDGFKRVSEQEVSSNPTMVPAVRLTATHDLVFQRPDGVRAVFQLQANSDPQESAAEVAERLELTAALVSLAPDYQAIHTPPLDDRAYYPRQLLYPAGQFFITHTIDDSAAVPRDQVGLEEAVEWAADVAIAADE